MRVTDNIMAEARILSALRTAWKTAKEQPNEVPFLPEGWIDQAEEAMASGDVGQLSVCADTLIMANAGCRANNEVRPWLHDLRSAS